MRPDELLIPAEEVRELTPEEVHEALTADPEVTLISDYLSGFLAPELAEQVKLRYEIDAGFRQRVGTIVEAWGAWPGASDFHVTAAESSARLQRIEAVDAERARASERQGPASTQGLRDRLHLRYWRAAALLLLAVGLSAAEWFRRVAWPQLTAPRVHHVEAAARENLNVYLGNGASAVLVPGSSLTWSDAPSPEGTRELHLDGSAEFRVRPGSREPHILLTPSARVQVTGTQFTVSTLDPLRTLVSVTEGTVLVHSRGARTTGLRELTAGEKALVIWGQTPLLAK